MDVPKMRGEVQTLMQHIDGWCSGLTEYQRIGENMSLKVESVLESFETASKLPVFQGSQQETNANVSFGKIVHVLKKIERMKYGLIRKTDVMLVSPMKMNRDEEISPTLEIEKEIKKMQREIEQTQKQMKKTNNPFKMQQHQGKIEELKKKLEVVNFRYESQLKEIMEKTIYNFVNWMMAYMFANLSFFRQGFKILEDLETDMKTTTENILKEETQKQDEMEKSRLEMMKKIEEKKDSKTSSAENQGFLRWNSKLYWFALTNGVLSYYKSPSDEMPKGTVDLLLCTAKENIERPTFFDLISPSISMNLEAPGPDEAVTWLSAIRMAIYTQLEQHKKMQRDNRQNKIPDEVRIGQRSVSQLSPIAQLELSDEGNMECVDCNSPNPDWASINYGVLVCYECSGVHRSLGTHISKIRSLTLDKWEPQMLQVMKYLGNSKVNAVMEALPPGALKPNKDSSREEKEKYITAKYKGKRFVNRELRDDLKGLSVYDVALRETDNDQMILQMLQLIVCKVNIHARNSAQNGTTVLHFLAAAHNLVGLEFILQHDCSLALVDDQGWSALHYAAYHDNTGCARLLINRGAVIDLPDADGVTPAMLAYENKSMNTYQLLLSETKGSVDDD